MTGAFEDNEARQPVTMPTDQILYDTLRCLHTSSYLQFNFLMWFNMIVVFVAEDFSMLGYEIEKSAITLVWLVVFVLFCRKIFSKNRIISRNMKALEANNPELKRDERGWFGRFFRGRSLTSDDPIPNEASK